jgi:uncharacterized phage protein (TIGR02218 family)
MEITRSALGMDITERNEVLEVSMPANHEFPQSFVNIVPGQIATFNLKRYHRTDATPNTVLIFAGKVLSVSFQENGVNAVFSIKTLSNNMNTQMPKMTYQSACNWVLFDANCGVNPASYRFTGTVSAVGTKSITVPGLTASKGNGWATGGYINASGLDYRFVRWQNNDVLNMLLPFHFNMVGQSVEVFAGCGHSIGTCSSKFNNVGRYGGCAWVPTKNIFHTGID